MPNKYYIDVKNNLRQVPKEKEGAFLKKYPGSRLATDKELTDYEDKQAKNNELTQREGNIQNGQGGSMAKSSTIQPLESQNTSFGTNQFPIDIPNYEEKFKNLKPELSLRQPDNTPTKIFSGSSPFARPSKDGVIADAMRKMPVSPEAYFDMSTNRYQQEKDWIEQIKNDDTISESVKNKLIEDYQNNIRTSDLTVEDKDLPPAAKDWLERNKVSREVTRYNPSMMGGGSYTTTVRENTPEQIEFIKDYIANSAEGKQYAQAHKEFIGQLESQADTLLDEVNNIRDTSKKNKEEYPKRHNISTWTLKGTNYRNDAILDKAANLLKNSKLLLASNREGGGFWKGLHMTNEDLKELAVITESFYNDKVLNQVIDKYQKDPSSLSKEENIIIQAKYIADQMSAGVDPGSWYNIGATTKQSLPFMRDFILTAPIGGGVASGVKGGLSALSAKTGANFLLSRGAGGVVSNLAKGAIDLSVRPAVQTMFSPSSYAMAYEEMQGQAINKDAQGNITFDNRKTAEHGMTSALIENHSEVMGEIVFDKLLQKFKIPVPKIFKTRAAQRLSSATGIQGPISEYLEEKHGDLLNIVRGEQTIEGFFDPRQNLETFGAVAIMQIPFSAINSTGYGIGKIQDAQAKRAIRQTYDKSRTNLNEYFGEEAEIAIENFNSLVDNSTEEELQNELISVIEYERLDDNAKRAIVEYVTSYSAYSGINKAKQEEVQQAQEQVTQQVQENVNPDMDAIVMAKVGGYEDPVQIWNGHIEYNEDGTINREKSSQSVTIINKDGKKVPVSINFVEELVENIPTEEATAQLSELATQEVTARQENDEVREYQAGERVRTIDGAIGRVAENEDGSVMTDDNGNYIVLVDTPAGPQQIATEPRNIINEDNLIGVENGSEVTYTNEQGEKTEGVVSTTPDLYAQGLIGFENGDVIPISNVEGLKQEDDMQLPPPPADMMIGENGAEPYNPNKSNSQESTDIAGQNEQNVTTAPREQNILSLDQIPKDEKGNILFDQVSVENTLSALGEVYDSSEIPSVIDATIANITKQVEKIQTPKPTGDITKDIASKRVANEQADVLNKRLAYWNEVKNAIQSSKPIKQQVTEQLTGEEKIETPTIPLDRKKEKVAKEKKPTPFQRRLNAVEDNVSTVRDRILFGIASGAYKFRWKDKGVSMGLAREMGLSGSEAERKSRIGILRNDGYTPSTLAHHIWEETGMQLNDNDIRSEVIDVLSSIYSRSQALEELERSAGVAEEQYLQEQAEASEYEQQLKAEVEARYNEILDQLIEEDLVSLRDEAVSLGATSEQITDVFTPTDFIDLIEQLKDGQQEQTSDRAGNNEQIENVEGEGNNDQRTQRAIGERNQSTENPGDSRQAPSSAGDRINLSPEQKRVVDNATQEIDAEIAEAEKELTTQQKELSSARKRLGKAQAETQTNLFGNEQQDKLFDVSADLSKENAVDNILSPIQQQIDAAQTKLDNLTNSRDARIQEALDNHRKQGNLLDEIARAEAETDTNPSEAQKEAGNYKKGKVTIQGFNISIEQPVGSTRSGVDAEGKEWSITMNNTYGYIRGTEGKDKDHIDVFLGNNPNSNLVFVVDQVNQDKSFDEHKVMFGFDSIEEAREAYQSNYEEGWQGLGNITEVDVDTFRKWTEGKTRRIKPFAEYKEIQEATTTPYIFSQEMIDFNREHGGRLISEIDFENTTTAIDVFKYDGKHYIGIKVEGFEVPFKIREGFESSTEAEEYLNNHREEIDNLWWDMQDILENKEVSTPAYGSTNALVSADKYEELKKQMRDKLSGQLNMGVDPEVFVIGAQMAMYHIEAGARKFADFSARMIEDLGDSVRPFLKSFYEGARHYPTETMKELSKEMDSSAIVSKFDIDNFNSEDYAKREPSDIQSDSQELRDREQVDKGSIPSESTEGRQDADGFMADDTRKVVSDNQVPRKDGSFDNSGRNNSLFSEEDYQGVSDGQSELPTTDSGDTRGSHTDVVGRQDDGPRESTAVASESQRSDEGTDLVERQRSIQSADVVLSDINNIRETLPVLKPEQQLDVQKAEQRYFTGAGQQNEVGAGMLFTNGTGTGKTFTGVGIIKRFLLRGINDIIIVVPNQKIASDWITTADVFFDEQFQLLTDTKDQGQGVIVTTYANYRQNEALNNRQWALIAYDECHYLNQNASGNPTAAQKQDGILGIDVSEAKALAEERIGHERPVAPTEPDEMYTLETRYNYYSNKEYTPEYEKYREELEAYNKANEEFKEKLLNLAKEIHENRPKKLYLSATPFAYHKSLSYADGSLFVINETFDSSEDYQGYNVPNRWESFMVENFGYRMRYNKLTVPENAAAVSRLEQLFHEKLVSSGAVSGRSIDVPYDYSRDFVVVHSGVGTKIDEGIHAIWNDDRIRILNNVLNKKWNYIKRAQFLEAAKSQGVKEHVDNLLANGYKVVIFHDFIKGNTQNPLHFEKIDDVYSVSLNERELARLEALRRKFDSEGAEMTDEEILELQDLEDINSNNELESVLSDRQKIEEYNKAVDIWNSEYSQYANLDFSEIEKPLTFFSREYKGKIGLFNGRETKRKRLKVAEEFNQDDSGLDIILVQRQAGKEGISFHDTTGNKPRVLINLGLPTAPTDAIQIEGRTYRIGLKSNTAFQYPILNTSYEAMAFAHKIASRSKTAENLALGTRARKLEDAFKNGYQNPIYVEDIDYQTIGEGSKEIDKFDEVEVSPYRDAVALFSTVLKNNKSRSNREGKDYYATPEPVGFKMVEWLKSKDNDSVLEPSAGHGAIARFFNPNITATAVEPSYELATRLKLNTTAEVKQHTFEDLHIVNKYDGIVMNPPFGVGGKTAIEHVEKAFKHLRTNGRMIAIVPNGGATQKRFDAFMESKDAKDAFLRATYVLPGVAFKNAGTNVSTKIVIIDKVADPKLITDYAPTYDYSRIDNIDELFDKLEYLEAPERIYDTEGNNPPPTRRVGYYDIVEPTHESTTEDVREEVEEGIIAAIEDYTHTKTGEIIAIARVEKKLGHNDFVLMARRAKELDGYWSRFAKGFLFENRESAEKFRKSENNRESNRLQSSNESLSSIPREKLDQLIDTLKQTGLAVDVVVDENIRSNPEIRDAQGNVYGYVTPNGVIHLDAQNMNANTPVHEFGHLWNDHIKRNNPELYKKGVELIKQSPYYWERIYNNPAYSNLSEERKIDEAMAMAIGDKGEGFVNRNMKQRFVDWLADVWKSIKKTFGFNSDVAIEDMSLSDFTDRAVSELLGGKELSSTPSNTDIDKIRFHSVNDVAEANNSTMTEEARIELDLKLKGLIGKIEGGKYAYVLDNLRRRGINVDKLNTTKVREAWEDRYLPVKKFLDVLRNRGVYIEEYNDFYLKATHLSGMNDSQLEVYNETLQKPLNRVIRELEDAGFKYRDVENYAILKHGIERNEWMRQNAIDQYIENNPDATPEQIEKYTNNLPDDYAGVTAIEKEVGMTAEEFITDFEEKAGSKLIDKFWKKTNDATSFSLKKSLESQLLSKKMFDELTARYQYYVPLRGHDETVAEDRWDYTPQMGTYFVNPIIKANGRRSRSETPFAFIAQQAQSSITAANKNTLNQSILRLANKDKTGLMSVSRAWYELKGEKDGQPLWEQVQAEYSEDANTYLKNIEMFEAKMQKLAEAGQAFQSGKKLNIGGLFIKPKQAEQHEVHVYQNGVDYVVYINANPAVAKAINGSNIKETSDVMKQVAKMSRFMAANFTTRNPIFVATNFSRDYLFASSILPVKENVKYALKFQRNIPEAAGALQRYIRGKANLTKEADRFMMEYIMNGAKTGYSHIVEIQKVQKEIEKDIKKGDSRNIAERVFQVFGAANEFAENLSRLSVYMTSRKEGRSITRSVSDAKEVTVNFNRSGAGGTVANFVRPAYLFVNAGIQALSNIAKVAIKNPKKISALFAFYTLSGAVMAPALAFLLGGDDGLEDYYNLGEWERQNNLCLYTGKGFIKIPLPHELRVFHRAGDNILHGLTGKKDVTETLVEIPLGFSDLIPIDPMGAVDASWAEYTPDFMKPFTQLAANKNFMGGRIYNEWVDPNTPGYLQARKNKKGNPFAPDILVNATKTLDNLTGGDGVEQGAISLNPDLVEHFARGYFGGLYSTAMQSINFTSKLAGFNKSGDISIRDTPLKTFFTSNQDLHVSSSSVNKKFYEVKDEIKEIKRKVKGYENQANKGDLSIEAFGAKINSLKDDIEKYQRVGPLLQEIEKYEKALKELDGEQQREIERHISEWKKQVIELNETK